MGGRLGNANTGFIAYLTGNADGFEAARVAQKPNPAANTAILAFVGGNMVVQSAPDRLWPLAAAMWVIGVGLAAKARRDADPDQLVARLWFWAVFAGTCGLLVISKAVG